LTNQEIGEIRNWTTQYNAVLVSEAQSRGLAVADVESFYSKITDGFVYNGITMSARFVSGGAYSLDGIHLNPRGNALLANEFIKAVNETYNAKIPFADATKYRGIIFP
jgi:lysophospholipase L1-like esterase